MHQQIRYRVVATTLNQALHAISRGTATLVEAAEENQIEIAPEVVASTLHLVSDFTARAASLQGAERDAYLSRVVDHLPQRCEALLEEVRARPDRMLSARDLPASFMEFCGA